MKKGFVIKRLVFFAIVLLSGLACAQDLDISLFDDTPNLGRSASPLDSVRITPPPAPDIRIDLDNTEKVAAEAPEPPTSLPSIPSTHIDLSTMPAPVRSATTSKQEPMRPLKDVTAFDLNELSLGMPANQILQKARQMGFKVMGTQEKVPLFYSTDYAYKCRKQGVIIPDQVSKCIQDYACHEKTRYIADATLKRKNEMLYLYFTTNENDNVLYKMIYVNKGDNSLNFSTINKARKLTRKNEFWNAIFEKYGYPDDEKNYVWGDPSKAYMRVFMNGSSYDGYIILEDVKLSNEDYFIAEDTEKERPPKNNFTF